MSHVSFDENTVKKVADLARLQLSSEEVQAFSKQLGSILGYIEKLNQLDTSKVEPMTNGLDIPTPRRADEERKNPGVEKMLSVAPESIYDNYKVPQVLGSKEE